MCFRLCDFLVVVCLLVIILVCFSCLEYLVLIVVHCLYCGLLFIICFDVVGLLVKVGWCLLVVVSVWFLCLFDCFAFG